MHSLTQLCNSEQNSNTLITQNCLFHISAFILTLVSFENDTTKGQWQTKCVYIICLISFPNITFENGSQCKCTLQLSMLGV